MKVLVQGLIKARRVAITQTHPCMRVSFEEIEDIEPSELSDECQKLIQDLRQNLDELRKLGRGPGNDTVMVLKGVQDPGRLADLTAAQLQLPAAEAQKVLEINDPVERLRVVCGLLKRKLESSGREEQRPRRLTRAQREGFLREQMRQIRRELGDQSEEDDPVAELRERIEDLDLPEEAQAEALKQLRRLEHLNPESTEASNVRSYLEWIRIYPGISKPKTNWMLSKRKILMTTTTAKRVKERILSTCPSAKKPDLGPILCPSAHRASGRPPKGSLGHSGESFPVLPWAGCGMKLRFAVTAEPMWAPCRVVLSKP